MQLATLDIDVDQAKAGLDEYSAALRVERTAEDEAIAAAYRAAARGLPIISLSAAVAAGGFFPDNGLPRVAICRADATRCTVDRPYYSNSVVTFSDEYATGRPTTALVGSHHVTVGVELPAGRFVHRATTVVPPVPPRYRPKRGTLRKPSRLGRFHILWEVEKWDPTPPRDPALLRHIRGDLWAVLATWDLTDVERAVLGQRMPVRP